MLSVPVEIGVIVLAGLTVVGGIRVAKSVLSSGIESCRGRFLLWAALFNVVAGSFIVVFLDALFLWKTLETGRVAFFELITAISMLILPTRFMWNYLVCSARLKQQFNLTPCTSSGVYEHINNLAGIMGIACPAILSSLRVTKPFVFGRSSKKVFLAVPADWQQVIKKDTTVILMHELAHIRNRDVGFLTWAFSFTRDLWWSIIIVAPAIIGVMFVKTDISLPWMQAGIIYACCIIILHTLYVAIVREREYLADKTVARLIFSGQINDAIRSQSIFGVTGRHAAGLLQIRLSMIRRFSNWLSDKALFGTGRSVWKYSFIVFQYFYSTHPDAAERAAAIDDTGEPIINFAINEKESFFAGVSIGILAVTISLAGYWFSSIILGIKGEVGSLLLSYDLLMLAVGPVVGFVAIMCAIPIWASLGTSPPNANYLKLIFARHGVMVAASVCAASLIILNGLFVIQTWILFVLLTVWLILVSFAAIVINIALISLWQDARYFLKEVVVELLWIMLCFYGTVVVAVFACVAIAIALMDSGKTVLGFNVIFSVLLGLLASGFLSGRTTISRTQQYIISCIGPWTFYCEGGRFKRWGPLFFSGIWALECFIPAFIFFIINSVLLRYITWNLDITIYLCAILILCCAALCIGGRRNSRVSRRKHQVYALYHSLRLLETNILPGTRETIERLLSTYNPVDTRWKRWNRRLLRVEVFFELSQLVQEQTQIAWQGDMIQFVCACENKGGFGLWPSCSSRLCSTYQSLYLFEKFGIVPIYNVDYHASWIGSMQCKEGMFQSQWSKRPPYQDTFFAIKSLQLLNRPLIGDKKVACLAWAKKTLLNEGLKNEHCDMIYYCLAVIDALDGADMGIIDTLDKWSSKKLQKLAFSNPVNSSDAILSVLRVYSICLKYHGFEKTPHSMEAKSILAQKLEKAIVAELSGLRF